MLCNEGRGAEAQGCRDVEAAFLQALPALRSDYATSGKFARLEPCCSWGQRLDGQHANEGSTGSLSSAGIHGCCEQRLKVGDMAEVLSSDPTCELQPDQQ